MIKYSVAVGETYVGIWLYSSSIDLGLAGSGYAESFTDVSDWTGLNSEAADSFTSDGDLGCMETHGDGVADSDYFFSNGPNITTITGAYYIELRYKCNTTNFNILRIHIYTLDNHGGTQQLFDMSKTTSWTTIKVLVTLSALESILFETQGDVGENVKVNYDYVHGASSDEMGWQHDGSTTAGVSHSVDADVTFSTSTDGDILTLSAIRNAGSGVVSFYIPYDITSTPCDIERDYYPFFKIRYNATLQGGTSSVAPKFALDGYWNVGDLLEDGTFRTLYINTANFVLTTSDKFVEFFANLNAVGKGFILELDFVKAYSIANFTVTQSASCTTSDYLYVDDSGVLQISKSTASYITLSLDPALSVDGLTYNVWNLTLSQQVKSGYDFYHTMYWSGGSQTFTDEETRGATPAHTIIDYQIILYTTGYLSAITFMYQLPEWYEVGDATLIFSVPFDTWALDMFLIFLGLFMVPASTIYMVKGGLKEASMTKVFFALVAFILGWAFFIGGIM